MLQGPLPANSCTWAQREKLLSAPTIAYNANHALDSSDLASLRLSWVAGRILDWARKPGSEQAGEGYLSAKPPICRENMAFLRDRGSHCGGPAFRRRASNRGVSRRCGSSG